MTRQSTQQEGRTVPLVVNVDGALLRTDLMWETVWAAFSARPGAALGALVGSLGRPAQRCERLCSIARPDIASLPVRQSVLQLAREAAATGRSVVLVSGAEQTMVDQLAAWLGLPGEHHGTNGVKRMSGSVRAALFSERFGIGGFDYVGASADDLAVWRNARRVIAVSPGGQLARRLAALGKPVEAIEVPWTTTTLMREMRPYQWVKNLVLLLPVLAAHDLSAASVLPVLATIACFSLGAAGVYLVNDMFDLAVDRRHPEKRLRPIASGDLPIGVATAASAILTLAALAIATMIGWSILALTLGYVALSLLYSAWLKHLRWLDLVALASLYCLRVIAGAVAAGTGISGWLLGVCFAAFFSLAAVKRLTDLARAPAGTDLAGRGYVSGDLGKVLAAALAGWAISVPLYLAYTFSPEALSLYGASLPLRLAVVPFSLWLLRMIWLSRLGREDYDPVRFVLRDRAGAAILATGVALVLLAL